MNREDLLKLLDLRGTEAAQPAEELAITPAAPAKPAGTSPTALELDEWALRRGRDLLRDSERLRGLGLDEHAVADFHECAFAPEPRLRDDCTDPRRQAFIGQLLETPDYQALHATTTLR